MTLVVPDAIHMGSEWAMLAFGVVLVGVAAAAAYFGWRELAAHPLKPAAHPPKPAPVPTAREVPPDDLTVAVPGAERKVPRAIIVAAVLLVLGNIAPAIDAVALLSESDLPPPLAFLGALWAVLPFVLAFGLYEGYRWAWTITVVRLMAGFAKVVDGTLFLEVGTAAAMGDGDSQSAVDGWLQLDSSEQGFVLVLIWASQLAVLVPLFFPSARRWCHLGGG
jgi:protein-S-isoprenylcysteine O-methyltransferase Ste14